MKKTDMDNPVKKPTIMDVAREAGVSKGTVSAVINQKSTVSTRTRQHVLDVMKNLNYRPLGMARNLSQSALEDKSIGLIIKDLNNPFYTSIAIGVKEFANRKGYHVFINSSENDHRNEETLSHMYSVKDIKGAIIAPVLDGVAEIEHLFKLRSLNYPFVLLEDVKGIHANVVSIDNNKAIRQAVNYLIQAGHQKIVHFAGPPNYYHTHERIEAFRMTFSDSHLIFNEDMILYMGAHYEESFKTSLTYFKNKERDQYPTAIICYNDLQALGVLAALKQLHIDVPEDVSLIGNDDIYYAKLYPTPLTTIKAPMHELGLKAAEILINNIESETLPEVQKITLDATLEIRASTRALK